MKKARLCDAQLAHTYARGAKVVREHSSPADRKARGSTEALDIISRLRDILNSRETLGSGPLPGPEIEVEWAKAKALYNEERRAIVQDINELLVDESEIPDTEPKTCEACGSTADMDYSCADNVWHCGDCGIANMPEKEGT